MAHTASSPEMIAPAAADRGSDPRDVLRSRRMNARQYGVVALCVLINMIDRYDILALAQAGSALRREWGMSEAALGTLLSMNLIGMAVGALGVSPGPTSGGEGPRS